MLTWLHGAIIDVHSTSSPFESRRTQTVKVAHHIKTAASILTRNSGGTVIYIHFTIASSEASLTDTFKSTFFIQTCPIDTRLRLTLIYVCLTVDTCVAHRTVTYVTIHTVTAQAIMMAGLICTVIDVNITLSSCITRRACTFVVIHIISTIARVFTGLPCTVIDVDFTVAAAKPRTAETFILVDAIKTKTTI